MGNTQYVQVDRIVQKEVIKYQQKEIIKYVENPIIKNRLQQAQIELSKYKDSKHFKQIVEEMKLNFLKDLPNMQLKPMINRKSNDEWHIAFAGKTSAGKSSLLNTLYGKRLRKKLAVALGKCTTQPQIALQEKNVTIWDIQGFDQSYDFTGQALTFLNSLDTVCVLYDGQIGDVQDLTRVLWALQKQVIHVRTKCDNHDQDNQNSVDYQISRDLNDIKKIPGANSRKCQVFATSKKGNYQNEELLKCFIR